MSKIVLRSSALAGLPKSFREASQTGRECQNIWKSGKGIRLQGGMFVSSFGTRHYFAWIYCVLAERVEASFRQKVLFT